MISIDNLKDNVISLTRTENDVFEQELEVVSKNKRGNAIPFSIEEVSSDCIQADTFGGSSVKLVVDTPNVTQDEYIILKNSKNERSKITIKANPYYASARNYSFSVTGNAINGILTLQIESKENNSNTPISWSCTYQGQPIGYDITPLNGNGGTEPETVVVKNKDGNVIYNEINSLLEFTQKESNNIIQGTFKNTPDGIDGQFIKKG